VSRPRAVVALCLGDILTERVHSDKQRRVHEGFKQMLVAGAHSMDLVLSVNDHGQDSLTAEQFVHLAAKLGVRVELFEAE
jgi:hypothetical protein